MANLPLMQSDCLVHFVAVGKYYRDELFLKKLGAKIRAERIKQGLSIYDLANLCDVEYSQITRIERAKINTSVSHLVLIADKLGLQPEYLIKVD